MIRCGIAIERVNQVWVAEITNISMARGFLYLVAVMDWVSRYVLAWRLNGRITRWEIGCRRKFSRHGSQRHQVLYNDEEERTATIAPPRPASVQAASTGGGIHLIEAA